jgi:hypothetical protein
MWSVSIIAVSIVNGTQPVREGLAELSWPISATAVTIPGGACIGRSKGSKRRNFT